MTVTESTPSTTNSPSLLQQLRPLLPYIGIGIVSIFILIAGSAIYIIYRISQRHRRRNRTPQDPDPYLPAILLNAPSDSRDSTSSVQDQASLPPLLFGPKKSSGFRRSMDFVCQGIYRTLSWRTSGRTLQPTFDNEKYGWHSYDISRAGSLGARAGGRSSRYKTGLSDTYDAYSDHVFSVAVTSEVSTNDLHAILEDVAETEAQANMPEAILSSELLLPPPPRCIMFPSPPSSHDIPTGYTPDLLPLDPNLLAPPAVAHRRSQSSDHRRAHSAPMLGMSPSSSSSRLPTRHTSEGDVWEESAISEQYFASTEPSESSHMSHRVSVSAPDVGKDSGRMASQGRKRGGRGAAEYRLSMTSWIAGYRTGWS
ncbi:hypothetical protein EVG20_g5986 [Dentipellis fragilis]|uniref:Uncharacterized protein n=1 Tax=Dentipellis fragilis TaxID=205917 RepID=A0A4Y9YRZ4_9AGAM|nr:hypothetical protein EVG20_g5986 [Dentipellis fragilis]